MIVNTIISEFNPFHNGHKYLIDKAKEITGAEYTICIMSGNFVQRGEPAFFEKYTRAKHALLGGADLVIELPVLFSTASAQYFAEGGVALADKLGVTNNLVFGSEIGDISVLNKLSELINITSKEYNEALLKHQKMGETFPLSRIQALKECGYIDDEMSELMKQSNNILAIEYMRALRKRNSEIKPVSVKRMGAEYNDSKLNSDFSSATSIRYNYKNDEVIDAVPDYVYKDLRDDNIVKIYNKFFNSFMGYRLLMDKRSISGYTRYLDVTLDLSNKIRSYADSYHSIDRFADELKSKNYTLTRIKRALLHIMLGIEDTDMIKAIENDYISYIKILGFKQSATPLLHELKEKASLPIITKVADADKILSGYAYEFFDNEQFINDNFRSAVSSYTDYFIDNDYTQKIVII